MFPTTLCHSPRKGNNKTKFACNYNSGVKLHLEATRYCTTPQSHRGEKSAAAQLCTASVHAGISSAWLSSRPEKKKTHPENLSGGRWLKTSKGRNITLTKWICALCNRPTLQVPSDGLQGESVVAHYWTEALCYEAAGIYSYRLGYVWQGDVKVQRGPIKNQESHVAFHSHFHLNVRLQQVRLNSK